MNNMPGLDLLLSLHAFKKRYGQEKLQLKKNKATALCKKR